MYFHRKSLKSPFPRGSDWPVPGKSQFVSELSFKKYINIYVFKSSHRQPTAMTTWITKCVIILILSSFDHHRDHSINLSGDHCCDYLTNKLVDSPPHARRTNCGLFFLLPPPPGPPTPPPPHPHPQSTYSLSGSVGADYPTNWHLPASWAPIFCTQLPGYLTPRDVRTSHGWHTHRHLAVNYFTYGWIEGQLEILTDLRRTDNIPNTGSRSYYLLLSTTVAFAFQAKICEPDSEQSHCSRPILLKIATDVKNGKNRIPLLEFFLLWKTTKIFAHVVSEFFYNCACLLYHW